MLSPFDQREPFVTPETQESPCVHKGSRLIEAFTGQGAATDVVIVNNT
ncbi:MAG: hypothetical protein GY926_24715 [bacterium]|nr:hypothetical protein [bacterium]